MGESWRYDKSKKTLVEASLPGESMDRGYLSFIPLVLYCRSSSLTKVPIASVHKKMRRKIERSNSKRAIFHALLVGLVITIREAAIARKADSIEASQINQKETAIPKIDTGERLT